MKTQTLFLAPIILLAMLVWSPAHSTANSIEQYPYEVLQDFEHFEVRHYQDAIFAKTHIDAETYRRGSGNGFRTLASYIFGGNERGESIAMTAPVVMSWEEGMVMEFMMPSEYSLETLPAPRLNGIEIYEKSSVVMAGLSFGGWANDRRIARKIDELSELLDAHGIAHSGNFQYFGYSSPTQVTNRRNDIVVELKHWE